MTGYDTARRKQDAPPGGPWFLAHEVMAETGVTMRELDLWCWADLIQPVGHGRGSGLTRWFNDRDIVCVRTVRALRNAGFDIAGAVVATVIQAVRSESVVGMVVVVPEGQSAIVLAPADASQFVSDLLAAGQTVTLVDGDKLAA